MQSRRVLLGLPLKWWSFVSFSFRFLTEIYLPSQFDFDFNFNRTAGQNSKFLWRLVLSTGLEPVFPPWKGDDLDQLVDESKY